MITAQAFTRDIVHTVSGEPVKVGRAPAGSKFILVEFKTRGYGVFSIDTGCYVGQGITKEGAVDIANLHFMRRSKKPDYAQWWTGCVVLFESYLRFTWWAHYVKNLSGSRLHAQFTTPCFSPFDV